MKLLSSQAPVTVLRQVSASVYARHMGYLVTPRSGGALQPVLDAGASWAGDNDAFTGFDADAFGRMLARVAGSPRCLFVTAPDVVGDAAATLALFPRWAEVIRGQGLPVALAAQDGLTVAMTPWDQMDALFIGGSTAWKLGPAAAVLAREAKARGLHVHMGRVNSDRRIQYARSIGVDSVDGSGYARFSQDRLPKAILSLQHHTLPMWEGLAC